MPISDPENVSISPKAISTLWCISPSGGQQKPAMSNVPPNTHKPTANINCTFFIIICLDRFAACTPKIKDFSGTPLDVRPLCC